MHKYGSKQKGSNSLFIFVIKITPLLGGGLEVGYYVFADNSNPPLAPPERGIVMFHT